MDLTGGILEGFGRLLKYDLKLYVYPTLDEKTGELVTAETLQVCLLTLWHICLTVALSCLRWRTCFRVLWRGGCAAALTCLHC